MVILKGEETRKYEIWKKYTQYKNDIFMFPTSKLHYCMHNKSVVWSGDQKVRVTQKILTSPDVEKRVKFVNAHIFACITNRVEAFQLLRRKTLFSTKKCSSVYYRNPSIFL